MRVPYVQDRCCRPWAVLMSVIVRICVPLDRQDCRDSAQIVKLEPSKILQGRDHVKAVPSEPVAHEVLCNASALRASLVPAEDTAKHALLESSKVGQVNALIVRQESTSSLRARHLYMIVLTAKLGNFSQQRGQLLQTNASGAQVEHIRICREQICAWTVPAGGTAHVLSTHMLRFLYFHGIL